MIDKITDEIAEIRENISILPHTKKADKKKYTEYLAKNITDYKEKEEYIKEWHNRSRIKLSFMRKAVCLQNAFYTGRKRIVL